MNRYKKLIGNSVIFSIGNFGSKLMQFIMVPIYSYTLNSNEFGKVDFLTTIVTLIAPIVCMDMFDAVFRFALDKNDNHDIILSTGFLFTCVMSGITIVVGIFLSFIIKDYPIIFTSCLLVLTMFYSLLSNYIRAVGFVKKFAIAGILNTFVMGSLNIVLLVILHKGITGYLLSMILSLLLSSLYVCLSTKIYKNISYKNWDKKKFNEMCKYSIPLIPNNLAWWLNSASDRFFIIFFLGAKSNGIYAMANKIPNMLSTLANIFFQSWQMSAVEEYSSKDSKKFITDVFEFFISLLFFFSLALMTFVKTLFKFMLSSQYYVGWKLTPFVLLTVIYSSLSGFLGTMYTATKKTGPILYTTIYGAVINVVLSVFLIQKIGIYGAAISNSVSFLAVSGFRFYDIFKEGKIDIKYAKFIFLHVLFFVLSFALFFIKSDIIIYFVGLVALLLQLWFDASIRIILKKVFCKFLRS